MIMLRLVFNAIIIIKSSAEIAITLKGILSNAKLSILRSMKDESG